MQPFQNVAREGKQLVVHRDADISQWCLCCAEPSDGRPITCHLRMDKSGLLHKTPLRDLPLWFYVLEYALYFIYFVIDLPASRKRKLTYGLCSIHRRKRLLMLWGCPVCLLAGFALARTAFLGSWSTFVGLGAMILGVGLLVAAWLLYGLAPGPVLTGQGDGFLWIKGAGEKFLSAHPSRAGARN
jgi:hypothetical protein